MTRAPKERNTHSCVAILLWSFFENVQTYQEVSYNYNKLTQLRIHWQAHVKKVSPYLHHSAANLKKTHCWKGKQHFCTCFGSSCGISIYLWSEVVCFVWFCFFMPRFPKPQCFMPHSWYHNVVYLFMKRGSLFCFVLFCFFTLRSPTPQCFMSHSLDIFGKLLMSRGALTWFETVWSYVVEGIDYWTIYSMKIN